MFFYSYRTITFIWLFCVVLTKSQSRDLIENLENIIEIREQTRRFNIDRDYYFDFQARPSLPYPKFYLESLYFLQQKTILNSESTKVIREKSRGGRYLWNKN